MRVTELKKLMLNLYLIFTLIIVGFTGILVFEDVVDEVGVEATSIIVDPNGQGDYTKIQDAINNSKNGDTIYIWNGVYFESIIINKSITLIGNGSKNTIINGSGFDEVVFVTSDYVNISGFTITGSGPQKFGLTLRIVENCTIEHNNFSSNDAVGFYVYNSNYTMIRENTFYSNNEGLGLVAGNNNTIFQNVFELNKYNGMMVYCSSNNVILSNSLNNNNNSFRISGAGESQRAALGQISFSSSREDVPSTAKSNVFENNSCLDNNYGLIIEDYSVDNKFFHNNISRNNFGLLIFENKWSENPSENHIFRNNFFNNINQTANSKSYIWDYNNISFNYWSDYNGLDNGANGRVVNDGIGDTKIPHLTIDNYPLMQPIVFKNLPPAIPKLMDMPIYNSNGNYTINWTISQMAEGYILQEADNNIFSSPEIIFNGSNLSFKSSNKNNGTYFYRIKAYNIYGMSNWSKIENITVDWPPGIPKNLSVKVLPAGNTLNLSWNLNDIDTSNYIIHSNLTGNWSVITILRYPIRTFNHTNLIDGNTYYYRIQAQDKRGQISGLSEVVKGIPNDYVAPASPKGLKVDSTTHNFTYLTWEPNTENDLDGYNIFRSKNSNPDNWGKTIVTVKSSTEQYIDKDLEELTTYYYVITAFDEKPNESGFSNLASGTTFLGQYGPEINNSISDFEIPEDTKDDNSINLLYWFKDKNNDLLLFWVEGNENISVYIHQNNGTVILIPEKNWNGKETLYFYASDGISNISDVINITITPINDPPGPAIIISPQNGRKFQDSTKINFSAICSDPDLIYGDKLTFEWSSNISGIFGIGNNLTDIYLTEDAHQITLKVKDQANDFAMDLIYIKILTISIPDDKTNETLNNISPNKTNTSGPNKPAINDPKNNTKPEKDQGKYTDVVIIGAIMIVIVAIVILLVFLFVIKKKEVVKEEIKKPQEEEKEETPQENLHESEPPPD